MGTTKSFGELTAETLRYGLNDSVGVNKARIEDWINEAQSKVASETDAYEFQETKTLTMVVGKKEIALPADFDHEQSIRLLEQEWRLQPIDIQRFDSLASLESTPTHYTLYKSELWLWPTPTSAEKLELRYIKSPTRMTAESDVPTLNENYRYLLVEYALFRAYEAEDDYEAAKVHYERFARELKEYTSAVQDRMQDRPKVLDGTWSGF